MDSESITLDVVVGEDKEKSLEIRLVDGVVIQLHLEGKLFCSGDWENNFKTVFERALEMWKCEAQK